MTKNTPKNKTIKNTLENKTKVIGSNNIYPKTPNQLNKLK
jgi:hypothetical protein